MRLNISVNTTRKSVGISTNNITTMNIIKEVQDGMDAHARSVGARVRENGWNMKECLGLDVIEGESDYAYGLRIIAAVRNGDSPTMDGTDLDFDAAYYAGMESVLHSLEASRERLFAEACESAKVREERDYGSELETDTEQHDAERTLRFLEKRIVGWSNDSGAIADFYAGCIAVFGRNGTGK